MWRHIASNFLTLAVALLVMAAIGAGWAQREYSGPGPLADPVCLRVDSGSNFRVVARDLRQRGAISSGYVFRVGASYAGKDGALKAGSFLIRTHMPMADIVEMITGAGQSTCGTEINFRIGVTATDVIVRRIDPATSEFAEALRFDPEGDVPPDYAIAAEETGVRLRITVAEGVTSWQIVEGLKRAEFMAGDIAEVPPEGMLAPESYEVVRGADRAALLAEMQARQAAILAGLWAQRAGSLPYDTPEEALIMASIIEKETGVPEERRLVASVFVNRLQQGMRLQTDPTVIYGVTKGQGVLGRGLRQSELRGETPYNTYVIDGMPPTPIANPGRAAIEAALNPDNTQFLFFVADGTGGHAFAETLDDHNLNVEKWRAIEAGRDAAGDDG